MDIPFESAVGGASVGSGHSISDKAGNILHMDGAVAEMLRRAPREIIGMSYLDLTCPADRSRNKAQVGKLVEEGASSSIRKRYLRADGSLIWADVHVTRLKGGRDVGRLVGRLTWAEDDAPAASPEELWRGASEMSAEIHLRRLSLGEDLFADHAWLIMLETYLAEAEGRLVDLATIAGTTAIPLSVVARWIKALRARHLIECHARDEDRFQLTGMGANSLEELFLARLRK